MRGGERSGEEMGLILKQGKGRRSPRGPVFMKGACSLQGRRSLALHVFILISHRPRYSRSIMIDKCPRLELKLLDLLVAINPRPQALQPPPPPSSLHSPIWITVF